MNEEDNLPHFPVPPFLQKLQVLVDTCDPLIGKWADDGKEFKVFSKDFEQKVLKKFYTGSFKSFIRQLHFYCFRKSEEVNGVWSFWHPKFQKGKPELVRQIRRKTRLSTTTFATKTEMNNLQAKVTAIEETVKKEISVIQSQLNVALQLLAQRENKSNDDDSSVDSSSSTENFEQSEKTESDQNIELRNDNIEQNNNNIGMYQPPPPMTMWNQTYPYPYYYQMPYYGFCQQPQSMGVGITNEQFKNRKKRRKIMKTKTISSDSYDSYSSGYSSSADTKKEGDWLPFDDVSYNRQNGGFKADDAIRNNKANTAKKK